MYFCKSNKRGKVLKALLSYITTPIQYVGCLLGACQKLRSTKPCPDCKPVYGLGRPGPLCFVRCAAHKNVPYEAAYRGTYNSFGGIDFHFVLVPFGGEAHLAPVDKDMQPYPERRVIREVQATSFTQASKGWTANEDIALQDLSNSPVDTIEGTIIASFFDREPIVSNLFEGKNDIVLLGNNEYGHQVQIRLSNVRIMKMGMGMSVDDLMLDISYTFKADSVSFNTSEYIPPAAPKEVALQTN